MHSPARGPLHVVRAGGLAGMVLAVTAVAHVAGRGVLPGPVALAALSVPVAVGAWAATRRRLSAALVLVLLAGGQGVLHEAFMALSPAAPTGMASMPGMAGMPAVGSVASSGSGWSGGHLHLAGLLPGGAGWVMLVCHVAATVVLGLAYARGERTLWCLWAWLTPVWVLVVLLRVLVPARAGMAVASPVARPHLRVLLVAVPRRGPPVGLAG